MKRIFHFILLMIFPFTSLSATDVISGRHRIDADWQFIRQDMANAWEVFRPAQAGKPESVPLWSNINLPHCWNETDAVNPDVNYYQGYGWYRKLVNIQNPYRGGKTLLEFEGAGQSTQVYVYTQFAGSHIGGYDRWKVDITDAVKKFMQSDDAKRFDGKIPIAVRCDNSRNVERIPSSMSDFNIYGGLYRHVNLLYQPSAALEEIRMNADLMEKQMTVMLRFSNTGAEAFLRLLDPHGKVTYQNKQPIHITKKDLDIPIPVMKPKIWDVDHPQLYTLEVKLKVGDEVATYSAKTGFRSFEFKEHGPFYLNGRRLLLQGTHRHEDHAGVGAAMTDEQIRNEMKQIKDMGANFIRLGHYQQSDLVLQLCDSLGILVWEEIPWCRGGLGGSEYRSQSEQMLVHMINQHFNHPSVILWGLGNENDWPGDFPSFDKASIHSFMSHLNNLSHQLDSSRKTTIRRCEFCSDITDVYSPSIWAGWYGGGMRDYRQMTEKAIARYPHFLHAEWGGDSHVGRFSERTDLENVIAGDKNGDWSETYMVHLFDWTLKEQQMMQNLTGTAFWTFKDFSTPLRPNNPIPYVNQKGVVERDGTPKESYYVFQSYWSKKPMIHIYGHNVPTRWGKTGEEKEVLVYSNCRKVELFVNGKSQGIKCRDLQDYPATGFHWNVILEKGKNKINAVGIIDDNQLLKGKVTGSNVLTDVIMQEYQTSLWGNPDHIRLASYPIDNRKMKGTANNTENREVMIEAQVVDANENKCLDNHDFVVFDVVGDAKLVENQGTSTGSRKIQTSNGQARIKVRMIEYKDNADMKDSEHSAVVAVKMLGLPTAYIKIF